MIEATVTVTNEVGLHARPAATFVKQASAFDSEITVTNLARDGEPANAKSVLSIFKAAIAQGHEIRIAAQGADEQEAVSRLVGLIESDLTH